MVEFEGKFNILFTGRTEYVPVTISSVIRDSRGHILYFEGVEGNIYNWANIVIMRKVTHG